MPDQTNPTTPTSLASDEFVPLWNLLRRVFDQGPSPMVDPAGGFVPRADVEELDDAFVVEIELPGVARHDVDVQQAGRRLTVTGERKDRERVGVLRHRTRLLGSFSFDLVLPTEVREDGVDATMAEGVLTIRVPKRDLAQARHVPIS